MPPRPTNPRPRHKKATKYDSRRHNLGTTLELVARSSPTSRAEISRLTGLTRAAVSSLVAELLEEGLLRELGPGPSAGGKPPMMLALNERGRDVIAVDLGTQPFQGALVDLSGRIHHRVETSAVDLTGDEALEAALALIGELAERAQATVLGIGVGTPGVVDGSGHVIEATNLDWHRLDLGSRIRDSFRLPVSVGNDAQIAALAEYRRHTGSTDSVLVVKLGQGIGAGVVLGGRLHRGDHFAAGEIGHIRVVTDGEACRCGNRGCLETVAGIPAIMRSLGADPRNHPWDALSLAGLTGEEALRRAVESAGRHLGAVLAHAVALLDVTRIVVSTELRNAGEELIDEIRASLVTGILPATADLVSVELSQLGSDLVVIGAASAVVTDRLGVVLR